MYWTVLTNLWGFFLILNLSKLLYYYTFIQSQFNQNIFSILIRVFNCRPITFFRVGSTGCQAYFAIGTRKHKPFVRQYDMQHNYPVHMTPRIDLQTLYHIIPSNSIPSPPAHLLIPASSPPLSFDIPGYDVVQDFTLEFLRIFGTSMSFDSFDELQTKMDEF